MTEYYRPDYTPEWFHLENYEPLEDMVRWEIYAIIQGLHMEYRDMVDEHMIEIPCHYNCETGEMEGGEVFSSYPFEFLEMLEKGGPIKGPQHAHKYPDTAIRPLTMGDYSRISETVMTNRSKHYKERGHAGYRDPVPNVKSYPPAITVQLSHDDKKILSDFEDWLKKQRSHHKPVSKKKRLSDDGLKKLIRDRIIPCMHLLIWGAANDIHYSDAKLKTMIFPDGTCSSDRQMSRYKKAALYYLETNGGAFHIL